MSPNEFQLRAALRDGEGEIPQANLAIADALRIRRDRRRLIASVASAAAVVAVVALGGTLVVRNDGGNSADTAGGAIAGGSRLDNNYGQPTHGGNPIRVPAANGDGVSAPQASSVHADASSSSDAQKAASGVTCPAQFPRQSLPGGGGTNQFGADGPLFDAPVAAMKICVYATEGNSSVELGTAAGQQLAANLEAAPITGDVQQCLALRPRYAIYAASNLGTVMHVVTAEPGCHAYKVTNGTAVRVVPFERFDAVHPAYLTPPPNQGSPPK
jgi:hypothetical protein